MKVLLFSHIVALLIISGCSLFSRKDEIKDFIPGTYIRYSVHEYGTEYDTLRIAVQSSNNFRITRRWRYERVLDGEKITPEYKRTTTTGIYDEKRQMIQDSETGEFYSFDISRKLLFNGPIQYKKI